MFNHEPKHILIAPLDWGLGHTTRCIPLIRHIQGLGHVPIFAGNAAQRSFIEQIFGGIDNIHLDGYGISYSAWNLIAQAGLLSQFPKIIKAISSENAWLERIVSARPIDGIISDNRYGLFHRSIPSVIITHQLRVRSGMGNAVDGLVQRAHYQFLNRFHNTWVADVAGDENLGGALSHPDMFPAHAKYIGLLSQFEGQAAMENQRDSLLVLLSGPEPQRSVLSRMLWEQVTRLEKNVSFVEGSENAVAPAQTPPHVTYHKRLAGGALKTVLEQAGMVICRSGYSTLMDLVALHRKAILIPTPGQTEQEYLGRYLYKKGLFYCARQRGFNIETSLQQTMHLPKRPDAFDASYTSYRQVLEDWVRSL